MELCLMKLLLPKRCCFVLEAMERKVFVVRQVPILTMRMDLKFANYLLMIRVKIDHTYLSFISYIYIYSK